MTKKLKIINNKKLLFTPENKERVVRRAKNKAGTENKRLVELAGSYAFFANLDLDNSSPLLNLCHYHVMNPKMLEYMGMDSTAYLVRFSKDNKFRTTFPKEFKYGKFNLEETIDSFKLLKVASESFDLQNFYNKSKLQGYVQDEDSEKLFDKISSSLTGVHRFFVHQKIDKNQEISPADYVIGSSRIFK
jgi:hypothetical protein